MKPLIIGQAPARGNDDKLPFAGASGARLASLAGVGESGDDLPEHFELRNLISKYPGKTGSGKGDAFDLAAAKLQAGVIMEEIYGSDRRWVLLMGKSVARAFGMGNREYLKPYAWSMHLFVIFPHPSGVNRWWNNPYNVEQAAGVLQAVLSDS